MLKILGLILGFFVMIISLIGFISQEEIDWEVPDDLYGLEEFLPDMEADSIAGQISSFSSEEEDVLPGMTAGIGTGNTQDVIPEIMEGAGEDVIPTAIGESLAAAIIAGAGLDDAEDVIAGDGPDYLEEPELEVTVTFDEAPEVQAEDITPFSAGIAPAVETVVETEVTEAEEEEENVISFGDGYSMQIPEVQILADGGDEDDYEIMGFSEGKGPAFNIRCMIPYPALTLEDLQAICEDLYGGSELVEGENLTYLIAYDDSNHTQLCIFPSEYSDQVYIIGMTGLGEEQPAQFYFDTIQ